MNPPLFSILKSEEDTHEFFNIVQKVMGIMGVSSRESVDLASYQLQAVGHNWFKQWKKDNGVEAGPIVWNEFVAGFLDGFFTIQLGKAKIQEFTNLKHGNISVKQYSLMFTQLARYDPTMVGIQGLG